MEKLYKNRENRDAEARRLKQESCSVKKYSIRNQQLHPEYVEDEAEYLREQTGFGNTIYRTFYNVLYGVRWYMKE